VNEYVLDYYCQQIQKVNAAMESARSEWSRKWLCDLDARLKRKLEWRMVEMQNNRSFTIDNTALEQR
jgi:hypothetical protein